MADLIDRQAALAELEERFDCHQKRSQRNIGGGFVEVHKEWAAMAMGVAECLDVVRKLPAVDAVEVVRCKDCKYSMLWRKPTDEVIGDCWIRKMNSDDEQFPMVGADDFCSYGKRREENAAD